MGHDKDHPLDCTESHVGCEDREDFNATADQHGLMPKADKIKLDALGGFGSWTNIDSDTNALVENAVYQVTSDGFVVVYGGPGSGTQAVYTDGANPPTVIRAQSVRSSNNMTETVPVRSGDYWKIVDSTGTPTEIWWIPIGAGECEIQP